MDIEVIGVWNNGAFRSKLEMKNLPDDAFTSVMDHLQKLRRSAELPPVGHAICTETDT